MLLFYSLALIIHRCSNAILSVMLSQARRPHFRIRLYRSRSYLIEHSYIVSKLETVSDSRVKLTQYLFELCLTALLCMAGREYSVTGLCRCQQRAQKLYWTLDLYQRQAIHPCLRMTLWLLIAYLLPNSALDGIINLYWTFFRDLLWSFGLSNSVLALIDLILLRLCAVMMAEFECVLLGCSQDTVDSKYTGVPRLSTGLVL